MHKSSFLSFALLMLLGAAAHAQTAGTITFTANKTSATGSLVPVLTWSTTPVASSCAASGAWSGTKFASGTETLAQITSSKSYTLTCSWGNGVATVNWTPPTKNTDGTSLTNLAGFKVVYGNSASALTNSMSVNDPKATSAAIPALGAGTWYFAVRAVTNAQAESANSSVVQKTITAASAAKTVAVTITASTTPPPPTTSLKTVSTKVYDIVWLNGVKSAGRVVGSIAIGKPCEAAYKVGTSYYRVTRTDVKITGTPRTGSLIARCATS